MSNKQARLVAAIEDAMDAQGISQNTLGRKSGVAQSMISAAILGKYDLKEEKWRLLCEALGLDYDEIVEGPEVETPHQSAAADSFPSRGSLEGEEEILPSEETRGGAQPFSLVQNRPKRKIWPSMKRSGICFVSPPVTLPAI